MRKYFLKLFEDAKTDKVAKAKVKLLFWILFFVIITILYLIAS